MISNSIGLSTFQASIIIMCEREKQNIFQKYVDNAKTVMVPWWSL